MKKNSKKRFKEKIKVTLKILVLFVIVKNIGYSEENLQDIEMGIEIKNKSNEVIDVSDINLGAYKEVNGLKIENSENISVNIDEINTILNKKTGTISSVLYGKGLINDTSEVYMSDELKINVTTEELEGNTTSLVGVTNGGKLILGENTKINIAANGNVASNSITYGVYLNGTSLTHFGRGSEINVSASAGFVAGISTNFSEINDNYGIVIGDNVKIKAEVTNAVSGNNNQALGIYSVTGNTVTIGNDLIIETEINLFNGATGGSYAIKNVKNGKMIIGNNAILSTKGNNATSQSAIYNNTNSNFEIGNGAKITSVLNSENQKNSAYTVYNSGNSTMNIGTDSEINVKGSNARQVSAVYNGLSSELVIEDKSIITAWAENTNFLMGLYNNSGGKMKIGNEGKITSIIDSKDQKNSAYSVYNTGNSTLNIGKNSEINVMGKGARQISALYNNGASSELIIEEGGTITALGENTVFVMGLYSENSGSIKIGDRVKIISSLDSIGQENNVFGISNTKNSTLNIGEKAEISAVGKDANQVVAVYNGGSSSKLTIENGSIITASGLGNNNIIGAVWNEEGNIKLNGGTSIYSDGYAVYNENGSVSIEDEGYSKKIQGDIFSTKAGAVTDILLDTDDSYLEGASFKNNGGIFNFGLKNNAVWYVPQNSAVTNFDIENGIVDMTQNYSGETIKGKQVISIDKTSGSGGTYIMDISPEDRDQTGDKTDGINIEKADAAQKNYIQAGKTSITGLVNHNFSDKENSSIKIASADKNVTFEGTKFTDTASIYDYVLSLEENIKGEAGEKNTWYVTGVEKQEGEVIKNIETAITLNYMSAVSSRSELNSVHKRLGEIHNGTSENGTWAGTSSGQMEHNKSSEKFKNEYNALQIGYDKRKETEKRSIFTGVAVHKKEGKTDFKNGDGKNYDIGISLYKSFVMEDNSYANLVVKYSYINNEHKNYTSDMQEMKTDYDTWSGSISFEYGKKYTKNSWYMIPQMQMDYTFVKGADYAMNSGIKVEQKNINSLVGRAGMYAGYDFERSSHFIKIGILQEFSGDYGARITGIDTTVNKKYKGKDTWLEAGIGGYFEVGKTGTTNIYYNIEKTFGSKFERNWQVSLGLRIKF